MRFFAVLRTFFASYIVPGWGFWIVGEPRLALATVASLLGLALLFGWTRLVLDATVYVFYTVVVIGVMFWSACHSAVLEYRRIEANAARRDWKGAWLFAVLAALVCYAVFAGRSTTLGYTVYRMPASSMAPTLIVGDYILVDTWRYRDLDIPFGEIAVFTAPESGGVSYVKRVVGLPGDSLAFDGRTLIRNGEPVDEPYAYYAEGRTAPRSAFQELRVPDDEYFVMGDNRENSRDSRYFGTVPKSSFSGRVAHLWFSRDTESGVRWSRFPVQVH